MLVSERPGAVPFPPQSGLGWKHYDLLRALGLMPLSSAADLGAAVGTHHSSVYRRLGHLAERGYLGYFSLGSTKERVNRWYISPEGADFLPLRDRFWHADWTLAHLADALPFVEQFYPIAVEQQELMGPLVRFRWFRGISWDAAARYENGWVAFFWSGIMQGEAKLHDTFNRFPTDLMQYCMLDERAFPSLLCFVVGDSWQRELVFRVAGLYGLADRLQVHCFYDGSISGVREWHGGRGWVGQVLEGGSLGNTTLERRIKRTPWVWGNGFLTSRLLDGVLEWPGMGIRFGQKLVGESGDSGRVRKAMGSLVDAGMVRRGSSRGAHSHVMDGPGFEVLRRRDRVSAHRRRRSPAHSKMPEERGLAAPEYGLMDMMGRFLDGDLDVAAGWRSWEDMGADGGGIAPDGLVLLRNGPYGPGWHYVEYELRARGGSRVVKKLRGYGSARRRDRWPVLVVVRDEGVERTFQEVGREGKIRMLTTTVDRLKSFGVLGDPLCWSMYGESVSLG